MLSLAPQRLINIEIISVVSELLSTRQKNKGNKLMYNWFLPVLNAQQTVCGEGLLQKWVEEHVSINQEIMELRTYERIIIPVSHGFAHWYLLVVSVQEHCAEIWDPVPSSMMSNIFVTEVQKILTCLDTVLNEEISQIFGRTFKFRTFSIFQPYFVVKD